MPKKGGIREMNLRKNRDSNSRVPLRFLPAARAPVRFEQRNFGVWGILSLPSEHLWDSLTHETSHPGGVGVLARSSVLAGSFLEGFGTFCFVFHNQIDLPQEGIDTGKAGVGQAMGLQNSRLLRTNSKTFYFQKVRKSHQADRSALK